VNTVNAETSAVFVVVLVFVNMVDSGLLVGRVVAHGFASTGTTKPSASRAAVVLCVNMAKEGRYACHAVEVRCARTANKRRSVWSAGGVLYASIGGRSTNVGSARGAQCVSMVF
jgi:hypothetical protein